MNTMVRLGDAASTDGKWRCPDKNVDSAKAVHTLTNHLRCNRIQAIVRK